MFRLSVNSVARRIPAKARRAARRVIPPFSTWHQTLPGADRLLERRWSARIRRAPVMSPEEHAAHYADPDRRHAGIEIPIGCALCDGRRLQELLHPFDQKHDPPRWNYHVVRCADCGFLFRHPGIRPERLGDLYATGRYAKFLGGKYTDKRVRRYEVTMAPFGRLFSNGDGRRLLDFGCGNGLFLDIAHERGFDCYGVDLAEDAIAAARKKPSGRHAYYGSPTEIAELAAGGFDVITMWSVLAHLAQPLEDLTMLRGLLGPDGVLLILTVNADSLILRRQLETWGGFTPNHLLFSSPRTLPRLLERAGFGAVVMPPWYGEPVEVGRSKLKPRDQRRLRKAVDRGNRGNMLRAAAFANPAGPARWSLDEHVVELHPDVRALRGSKRQQDFVP
jgi:SAM-dependent methyltransferase